jgi:hypothetical protein
MADYSKDPINVTRRLLMSGAPVVALAPKVLPPSIQVAAIASEWLSIDAKIERIYLTWSRLEASLIHSARDIPLRRKAALRMKAKLSDLDGQLGVLSAKRDAFLTSLQAAASTDIHSALSKLVVASRRLEGEGDPEHRLVSDAVAYLARASCEKCGSRLC